MPKILGAGKRFSTRFGGGGSDRGNGIRRICAGEGSVTPRLCQAGFSLVELMVAITIGLIIVLAISVLFSQITRGFRTTDNSSRAMENGNFALRVVGEDLRMVGFVGMSKDSSSITTAENYVIDNNCTADSRWPFLLGTSVESVDPATLGGCVSAFVSGSPAIVVRHATGMETPPASLVGNNSFFVQTGMTGGLVFQGDDYANSVKAAGRYAVICGDDLCATTEEAPIFGYAVSAYYIRPCSRESGAVCSADNDEGPTLVRLQLNNTAVPGLVETPIATGVERFAVTFLGENGAPAAPGVAIIARISMLVRTGREADHDDSASTYTLADGTTFNCGAPGSEACKFRRFVYDDTVVLKNFDFRR